MIIAGIDTSGREESITIIIDGKIVKEKVEEVKSHSSILVPNIVSLLSEFSLEIADVDGWGVAIGPGSFTGLRIGLATVKGFVFGTSVPVVGVTTLRAMALSAAVEGYVSPMIDARKGEIYTALYRIRNGGVDVMEPEQVISPYQWIEKIDCHEIFSLGSGVERYRYLFESSGNFKIVSFTFPVSRGVALVAMEMIGKGYKGVPDAPFYIRKSEAEINLEKRKKID